MRCSPPFLTAARTGIRKFSDDRWEVAGVITHPEYRQRGYSTRLVAHCTAHILLLGKPAFLSTAETNHDMQRVAGKVGFVPEKLSSKPRPNQPFERGLFLYA